MSWPVKTNYIPWKSKPTKLYPIAKEGILSSLFAIRLLRLDFQGHKKKTLVFSHPLKKYVGSTFDHGFFQIIVVENSKKKEIFKKTNTAGVFRWLLFSSHVDPLFDKFDPHLSANHCLQLPWRISHQRVCPHHVVKRSPVTRARFGMSRKLETGLPTRGGR